MFDLRKELHKLLFNKMRKLGEGAYGETSLIRWKDSFAVVKVGLKPSYVGEFVREASFLRILDGAGGAPRLLAEERFTPALLMTYCGGQTLHDVMHYPCGYDLLEVAFLIGQRLKEIHDRGVIHNDLKANNIIVSGTPDKPRVSIIDMGLACCNNTRLPISVDHTKFPWMAPEISQNLPSTRASDLYSYAHLVKGIMKLFPSIPIHESRMVNSALDYEPMRRPKLDDIMRCVWRCMMELRRTPEVKISPDVQSTIANTCSEITVLEGTPHPSLTITINSAENTPHPSLTITISSAEVTLHPYHTVTISSAENTPNPPLTITINSAENTPNPYHTVTISSAENTPNPYHTVTISSAESSPQLEETPNAHLTLTISCPETSPQEEIEVFPKNEVSALLKADPHLSYLVNQENFKYLEKFFQDLEPFLPSPSPTNCSLMLSESALECIRTHDMVIAQSLKRELSPTAFPDDINQKVRKLRPS